jgi:hypothetical protein
VTITVNSLGTFTAPAGTVPGVWDMRLIPTSGSTLLQQVASVVVGQVFTFTGVASGIWEAALARLDSSGALIGQPVLSAPIVIP